MSTKIYNGHVMPMTGLLELSEKCKALIPLIKMARANKIKEFYPGKEGYKEHQFELQKRAWEVEKTKQRDPTVDYSFELAILPIDDKILLIPYCEHQALIDVAIKGLGAGYYGYWNNVDPDEKCTEEEWEQREKDWDKALPGAGIPSQNGFNFTFLDFSMPYADEVYK